MLGHIILLAVIVVSSPALVLALNSRYEAASTRVSRGLFAGVGLAALALATVVPAEIISKMGADEMAQANTAYAISYFVAHMLTAMAGELRAETGAGKAAR